MRSGWTYSHGIALKRLNHSDRQQKLQKIFYYHLPTNHWLSKFQMYIESQCPDCNHWDEDDDHIIWCNHNTRLEAKQLWEADVHHYLSVEHTPPMVRTAIMLWFHHWIYHKQVPNLLSIIPEATPALVKAFKAQSTIGWNHFIRGRLSVHWKQMVMDHLAATKSRKVRTSNEWTAGLVISLWQARCINTLEFEKSISTWTHFIGSVSTWEAKVVERGRTVIGSSWRLLPFWYCLNGFKNQ